MYRAVVHCTQQTVNLYFSGDTSIQSNSQETHLVCSACSVGFSTEGKEQLGRVFHRILKISKKQRMKNYDCHRNCRKYENNAERACQSLTDEKRRIFYTNYLKNYGLGSAFQKEPEFFNFSGAWESIQRNRFRQPMLPGGPVRGRGSHRGRQSFPNCRMN